MNLRRTAGALFAYTYNAWVGHIPMHWLRRDYLRFYLGSLGAGTTVQLGCRFLNGRKVSLGERNVVNFGCLFDGRRFSIRTGSDVEPFTIVGGVPARKIGNRNRAIRFRLDYRPFLN